MARRLVGLGAVAHALDQLDAGHAVLQGQRVDEVVGSLVHVVGAATGDREVVAADRDGPPVDLAQAHHVRARREAPEVAVLVVGGRADQRAGLDEAAGVDEGGDAFPDRRAATAVLSLDALGSAHLLGQAPDVVDVGDGPFPAHPRLPALTVRIDRHRTHSSGFPGAVEFLGRDADRGTRRSFGRGEPTQDQPGQSVGDDEREQRVRVALRPVADHDPLAIEHPAGTPRPRSPHRSALAALGARGASRTVWTRRRGCASTREGGRVRGPSCPAEGALRAELGDLLRREPGLGENLRGVLAQIRHVAPHAGLERLRGSPACPRCGSAPRRRCWMGMAIPRCFTCGSAKTSAMSLIGPHGMPTSSSRSIQ